MSYYKLNLLDIVDSLDNIAHRNRYNKLKSEYDYYLVDDKYINIIIILIYLTIFFKNLTYNLSSIYNLILKQTETQPKVFISSSKGEFDFSKDVIYTELPDMNKFVKIGNYTFFEMKWFLSYLNTILFGRNYEIKHTHIQVHVFILTDISIPISQCRSENNAKPFSGEICIRKHYNFIGYEPSSANAFVFKKSIYDRQVLLHIGCLKIYKTKDEFENDTNSQDITSIQTVSKNMLVNTPEYRSVKYNRKLFNYNPTYAFQSQYNRKWRHNANVQNCQICNTTFTFLIRKHHCRYCGKIICSDCSNEIILRSWFEKNGTMRNDITNPGDVKERRVCTQCFDKIQTSLEPKEQLQETEPEPKPEDIPAGGRKIKNKCSKKKVGVYRTKNGYYYRMYKNGKKKRISKEMYFKIKKSVK